MNFTPSSHLIKNSRVSLPLIMLIILIISAGYVYQHITDKNIRSEKYDDLKIITQFKVNQIVEWNAERYSEAQFFSTDPTLIRYTYDLLKGKDVLRTKSSLQKSLSLIKENHGYENIFIMSANRKLLFSLDPQYQVVEPSIYNFIDSIIISNSIFLTDFYYCQEERTIHLDLIAPIFDHSKKIIATLVFRIDPYKYLYPLIKPWPVPSRTSETLLIRKEGDSVLFLNELRHKKNTAFRLRIPLTNKVVPAVQAVLGYTGIFEGYDYRGVEVLSYTTNIPGSSWFMVAKVDKSELLSELGFRTTIVTILMIVLILLSVAGFAWFYYSRQKNIFRELFLKEKELREAQEEFKTTLYSIGDGVITTDKNGIVKQMNPLAEKLTGWSEADAKGKSLENVLNIINEQTRQGVVNPVKRVLVEGVVVGLANHTLLISKEGKEIPIADSGAPIKNEKDEITGVVLVFSDQTRQRAAQKKLEESKEKYKNLFQSIRDAIILADTDRNIISCNPAFTEIFGYSFDEIKGKKTITIYENEQQFVELGETIKAHNGTPFNYTVNYKRRDGTVFPGETAVFYLKDSNGNTEGFIGLIRDVSERIKAETALKESERFLSEAQSIAHLGSYVWDISTGFWKSSKILDEIFGIDENYIRSFEGWADLIHPDWRIVMTDYVKNVVVGEHKKFEKEYKIIRQVDGRERWVYGLGDVELDKNNQPLKLIGTIIDITDRKMVEEELRKLKDELEIKVVEKTKELNERVAELERFHDATVDRELRMKELRNEIDRLKNEKS